MKLLIGALVLASTLSLAFLTQPNNATYSIGYNFIQPQLIARLPTELEEISGLSLDASGRYLLAVQDEEGIIYFIDKQKGTLSHQESFWDEGDYEGIEAVGDYIYVVKNTGTIYKYPYPKRTSQETQKFNGFLNSDNDVEGLGYDPIAHRLLLACKDDAGKGFDKDKVRVIFSFDLRTETFDENPVYRVERKQILSFLESCPKFSGMDKLEEFFEEDYKDLGPSAIARHPITGHLYLTSSVGKILLVLNEAGEVVHLERLSKRLFPQPEGLCFDSDGTLYISSEGKGGPGLIYRLNYQPR